MSCGEIMIMYRVALINSRLNQRIFLDVMAKSRIDAEGIAKEKLKGMGREGFDNIESVRYIGWKH